MLEEPTTTEELTTTTTSGKDLNDFWSTHHSINPIMQ